MRALLSSARMRHPPIEHGIQDAERGIGVEHQTECAELVPALATKKSGNDAASEPAAVQRAPIRL